MKQSSFSDAEFAHPKKQTRRDRFLHRTAVLRPVGRGIEDAIYNSQANQRLRRHRPGARIGARHDDAVEVPAAARTWAQTWRRGRHPGVGSFPASTACRRWLAECRCRWTA
jgi:hypothetical protein